MRVLLTYFRFQRITARRWLDITAAIFLIATLAAAQSGVLIPLPSEKPDPDVLSLAAMNVDILIDNQHATVKVMQIFDNHTSGTLEGKYVFGLPNRSSIADFAVWDNELRIPGVMMEKQRANQIYESIKHRRTDPGILQTTDADESSQGFSAKIFPINAYGTKRLELEYTEELPVDGLSSELTFPLKPSYGEKQTVGEFNLSIKVLSEFPIEPAIPIDAPYPLQVTESAPNQFNGEFHAQNIELKDDFSFQYKINAASSDLSATAYRAPEIISAYDLRDPRFAKTDPDGYFQARAIFAGDQASARQPKRVILLLDTSLSMYGDKIARAVEAIDFFLHSLTPQDEFNLILFNEGASLYSPKPVPATPDGVEAALKFVKDSSLGGGTDLRAGLKTAVDQSKMFSNGDPSVVLISDANPTLGTTQTREISSAISKSNAKLFAFALGVDANDKLLKDLTETTHGYFDQVRETEDISAKLALFFQKVGVPGVTDAKLRSTANLYDVYPSVADTYFGSEASFVGRYRKAGPETITLAAQNGPETISLSRNINLPEFDPTHFYLPRIWAKARIDALLQIINRDGEREDLIAEIIRLSEKYKLVTPYTAFIAAPRSLLRPRLIQPGDPVIRVKTDPSVTNVFTILPFGETLPMKFLANEGVWEARFLAPPTMADGTYKCRLLLTDKAGKGYEEQKSFVIDSRAPKVSVTLDKTIFQAGEGIYLRVGSDTDTKRLVAKLYGAKRVELRWSAQDKANTGTLRIPDDLPSGKYVLTVLAEDFADNQSTQETRIEVLGK